MYCTYFNFILYSGGQEVGLSPLAFCGEIMPDLLWILSVWLMNDDKGHDPYTSLPELHPLLCMHVRRLTCYRDLMKDF